MLQKEKIVLERAKGSYGVRVLSSPTSMPQQVPGRVRRAKGNRTTTNMQKMTKNRRNTQSDCESGYLLVL